MRTIERKVANALQVDKVEYVGKNSFGAREFHYEGGSAIYVTDGEFKKGNSELKNRATHASHIGSNVYIEY